MEKPWLFPACVVALLAATLLAFAPVFRADFIRFDDQYYVQENKQLRDLAGLRDIWSPAEVKRATQFYPLTKSSFWLEYRLWGLDARGYHATNLVLHLVNVLLVLFLAMAFGVSRPVAWITAAVFALHPTQVESVAWVTERKNVLSTLFYLLAFLAYLRHRRDGGRAAYAGCLAAFAAALLSKTQTITLPASIFLADLALQQTGRLRRASFARVGIVLTPMLVLALGAAVLTVQAEARHLAPPAFPAVERLLVAANAAAFYVRLFLFPVGLAPIYPKWEISPGEPAWWLAVAAWPVVLLSLYAWRRELGALALWGVAHFFLCLAPVLGFVSFNFFQFSFVADHFLYLSIIGGGLVVALLAERVVINLSAWPKGRMAAAGLGLLVLVGCGVQTYRQTLPWRDNEAFWSFAVSRNPGGFGPNWNLGLHYKRLGLWRDALPWVTRATQIWPNSDFAFRRYVLAVAKVYGPEAALTACDAKVKAQPRFYAAYLERGIYRERLNLTRAALGDYRRAQELTRRNSKSWREAERRAKKLSERLGGAGGS